jgi:hypothetical protein
MIFLASVAGCQLLGQQIDGKTCDNTILKANTPYSLSGTDRVVTNGTFANVLQSLGVITFDGRGNGTVNYSGNSNSGGSGTATGQVTYNIGANCTGTITNTSNGRVYDLVVYAQGNSFNWTSSNNSGKVSQVGGTLLTPSCQDGGAAEFVINANGFVLSGTNITGVADLTGLFQTDGMGHLTATWTVANGATETTVNTSGTYTIPTNCQGTVTLTDSTNMVTYSISFNVVGNGSNFQFIGASPNLIFAGAGHSTS